MELANKIAVITGAGRRIGESIAHAFAEDGADLILTAHTRQQLDRESPLIERPKIEPLP